MNLALKGRLQKGDKQRWAGGEMHYLYKQQSSGPNMSEFQIGSYYPFPLGIFLRPTDLLIYLLQRITGTTICALKIQTTCW